MIFESRLVFKKERLLIAEHHCHTSRFLMSGTWMANCFEVSSVEDTFCERVLDTSVSITASQLFVLIVKKLDPFNLVFFLNCPKVVILIVTRCLLFNLLSLAYNLTMLVFDPFDLFLKDFDFVFKVGNITLRHSCGRLGIACRHSKSVVLFLQAELHLLRRVSFLIGGKHEVMAFGER